jgi:hypothetical protein
MAAAIERRSRYLRDFAHAVSHRCKYPLAGIAPPPVDLLQDHPDMAAADRGRVLPKIARTQPGRRNSSAACSTSPALTCAKAWMA